MWFQWLGDWRYAADILFIIMGVMAILINAALTSKAKYLPKFVRRNPPPMQSYPMTTTNVAVVGTNTAYVNGQVMYQVPANTTVVYPAPQPTMYVQQPTATVVTLAPPQQVNYPPPQNYYN